MGQHPTQMFPPKPAFTENDIPSLVGKVFIVTGGNAGLGLEIVKILYAKGGIVYMVGRSPSHMADAIEMVQQEISVSSLSSTVTKGQLKSLYVDLNDLTTISKGVADFLAQESRLDVLWNNAGITEAPLGTTTVQGYEAHMGINCLGPFLLTKLLLPILTHTAATSALKNGSCNSVRVIFTSSQIVDLKSPPGGLSLAELDKRNVKNDAKHNYSTSKAGNWMLASEFDRRIRSKGVICVTQNPGNLRTSGWNEASPMMRFVFGPILYPARQGAYTALWAGLSPDVTIEDGGRYAIPWGRWHSHPRKDIPKNLKSVSEGGTGVAGRFWEWCEEQTVQYT